jgi:hypothetical protein
MVVEFADRMPVVAVLVTAGADAGIAYSSSHCVPV